MATNQDPEWIPLALLSFVLILNSLFLEIAPAGPWGDTGFSLGIIGISGLAVGYVAWYRYNFKRRGLIPWVDLWEDPARSARLEMVLAFVVLSMSWTSGNILQSHLPDPTGLLLSLIGLLLLIQSTYVMLVLGPLKED
ncbi:MAG: hypothetical protein CMA00_003585 [Methanobacteriota archaeon]|nr:hypothetical protein [Candidatus Thermoplasmatota archaeon]RAH05715.1 MAG: hypothetical protein CMA00_003585 [Euryarchaeota archaeon]